MKKCKNCGMLSADTATACRGCNFKFTEDDKPIEIKNRTNKTKTPFIAASVIMIAIIVGIVLKFTVFSVRQSNTDIYSSVSVAQKFLIADFEGNTEEISKLLFENYINYQKNKHNDFTNQEEYVSRYFQNISSGNASVEIVSAVEEKLTENDVNEYLAKINQKYSVEASQFSFIVVEVSITDKELHQSLMLPIAVVKIDSEWYAVPEI